VENRHQTEDSMSTKELADLIDQKHDVLIQLHQLGRQQGSLIQAEEINNLLVLLSAKQTLLNQLQMVEQRLEPFRHQDPEARAWPTPEDRQRCAGVAQHCERLLAEIVRIERQSEQEMQRRRDVVAARLEDAGSAAQARQAYMQSTPSGPERLDLVSGSG
jgi:flagellar biosynthesis/type III secretory pathway chaperone